MQVYHQRKKNNQKRVPQTHDFN